MNFQEIKEEFITLSENGTFRMDKIQNWLITYSHMHKKSYDFVYSQHLYKDQDGSIIRLPQSRLPSDKEIFLGLYDALNKILDFYSNESYFEQEIAEYYKIINSHPEIKTWIAKNENLGAKEYVSFMLDYLDYDENDRVDHLKIYIHNSKELEIYIDRQDFKNTIAFLEIFNELYWNKEYLLQKRIE